MGCKGISKEMEVGDSQSGEKLTGCNVQGTLALLSLQKLWLMDTILFFLCKALWLSFLFKSCGLWTQSCDFASQNDETIKWLSMLTTLMQKSFWW